MALSLEIGALSNPYCSLEMIRRVERSEKKKESIQQNFLDEDSQ